MFSRKNHKILRPKIIKNITKFPKEALYILPPIFCAQVYISSVPKKVPLN